MLWLTKFSFSLSLAWQVDKRIAWPRTKDLTKQMSDTHTAAPIVMYCDTACQAVRTLACTTQVLVSKHAEPHAASEGEIKGLPNKPFKFRAVPFKKFCHVCGADCRAKTNVPITLHANAYQKPNGRHGWGCLPCTKPQSARTGFPTG